MEGFFLADRGGWEVTPQANVVLPLARRHSSPTALLSSRLLAGGAIQLVSQAPPVPSLVCRRLRASSCPPGLPRDPYQSWEICAHLFSSKWPWGRLQARSFPIHFRILGVGWVSGKVLPHLRPAPCQGPARVTLGSKSPMCHLPFGPSLLLLCPSPLASPVLHLWQSVLVDSSHLGPGLLARGQRQGAQGAQGDLRNWESLTWFPLTKIGKNTGSLPTVYPSHSPGGKIRAQRGKLTSPEPHSTHQRQSWN